LAELAALARKDMGNSKTKIDAREILKSLFSDEEEYLDFEKEFIPKKNFFQKLLQTQHVL
jgi:hypothetical protein